MSSPPCSVETGTTEVNPMVRTVGVAASTGAVLELVKLFV